MPFVLVLGKGNSKNFYSTGWCSTPTWLLIRSSFSGENDHLFLICSSLSTAQLLKRIFNKPFTQRTLNWICQPQKKNPSKLMVWSPNLCWVWEDQVYSENVVYHFCGDHFLPILRVQKVHQKMTNPRSGCLSRCHKSSDKSLPGYTPWN